MTSEETEDYEFHRKHTPESPRPIYPPEPSNIPVLRNQNDPAFTDSSTYDIRPSSQLHAVDGATSASEGQSGLGQEERKVENGRYNPSAPSGPPHIPMQGGNESLGGTQAYGFQNFPNQMNTQTAYQSYLPHIQNSAYAHPNFQASQTLDSLANGQKTVANDEYSANRFSANQSSNYPDPKQQPNVADNANTTSGDQQTYSAGLPPTQSHAGDGVNYQSLLDTLTRSASAAPSAETVIARNSEASHDFAVQAGNGNDKQLPSASGLPPRPPVQDNPAMHPDYTPNEPIQSYHQINTPHASSLPYQAMSNNLAFNAGLPPMPLPANSQAAFPGSNGLPPPPMASFQQGLPNLPTQSRPIEPMTASAPFEQEGAVGSDDGDHKWGPEVQSKYDRFLADERAYVTEGVWDRFPNGSRMFVGNLPTEKVTKRDLFHIFHKHGKLAQISIKQAYGFVQFLDASDCYRALEVEQGVSIRGRRLHLEISKPQKNTRNPGTTDSNRQGGRKRSGSPERRGASRRGQDRVHDAKPGFTNYRDEPIRRRDDYKLGRSPSPRIYRGRDDHRGNQRYPGNERSRSPYSRSGGRYRSPSPRGRGFGEEAGLPIPRRHPNDVPDVQILVLDEVDHNFVSYLENALRSRGLQCQTLILSPRFTLEAVVKRQIVEGVQAIIKLTRSSQYNHKVPLQVFDRSAGVEVRFNEYVDLEISIAAEIVLQNKRSQRPRTADVFPTTQSFVAPQVSRPHGTQPSFPHSQTGISQDPNVTNLISNLDSASLQKLLSAMQQQPLTTPGGLPSTSTPASPSNPDLASLLSNVARQQQQQQQQQQHARSGSGFTAPTPYPPQPPQDYSGGNSGQDIQNIMSQLSQFQRRR